jgi:hypothetical protein
MLENCKFELLPDVYHVREVVELEFVDGRIQFRCHGAFEKHPVCVSTIG